MKLNISDIVLSSTLAFTLFPPYLYPINLILPALNAIKLFIKTVPKWAFLIVLVVIFVQSANMVYNARMPVSGEEENWHDGHYIIDYIKPGGPVDKAGIKLGDTIVSCNHYALEEWFSSDHGQEAGDTLIFGMLRNGQEVGTPVVITSRLSMYPWVYWPSYVFFVLVSVASLYIMFKKPKDRSVALFFLFIQASALMAIGGVYMLEDPVSLFVALAFLFCGTISPAILIHFHLMFPKPARFFSRYKRLPVLFYGVGGLFFLFQAGCIFYQRFFTSFFDPLPFDPTLIGIRWGAFASIIAIATAIFQLFTIKDTLARNQLLIVVTGTIFGVSFTIFFAAFYNYVNGLWNIYPNLVQFTMRVSSLVLVLCLLIAIFRFRIWNIEVVLKKALLYLGATAIIICTYLLLLYLVELMTIDETNITRLVTLAISVMIFLVSRDRMQRLVEKVFHRESYDSATVVSEFEENLAGAFRIEDVGYRILDRMDEIFHFSSVILCLNKEKMTYETGFIRGAADKQPSLEFQITGEFENKLLRSKVFSPGELANDSVMTHFEKIELVVPMIRDGMPYGFFLCGPKKSEKAYSMQDIRVLSLIAKRVIALFHTAELYQKDLDRQLALERERARIAQDMHDDIGAGLTKIAMLSVSAAGDQEILQASPLGQARNPEPGTWEPWNSGTKEWERMQKVATTARAMITRLNVIVWALNPRYDNLESLVSYARRYFGEYLENFNVGFKMEVPDEIPDVAVTPDFRRNAFYAWQEAIHNAVKHGKCSEILFEVKIIDQKLQVTITDNGKGFDQTKPGSGGNGLLNMKKRAEEMGGTFEITSAIGNGTKVSFEF
jgi:signal transduction histidine kinase